MDVSLQAKAEQLASEIAAALVIEYVIDPIWVNRPAADAVFIPIQCEYFAMEGLTQLIQTIKRVMVATDGRLTFGGILLTMYDPLLELTREVDEEVRDFFGDIVFDSVG